MADGADPEPEPARGGRRNQGRQEEPASRWDIDRRDDRRLETVGQRLIVEARLERLPKIVESFLHGLALTGDLDLETAGDVPRSLVGDGGGRVVGICG